MAPSSRKFILMLSALCMIPAMGFAGRVISTLTDPDNPHLPKDARAGSCYAQEIFPAIIETVTNKTLLTPEKLTLNITTGNNEVVRPATYTIKVMRRIVSPRREVWFETICPHLYSERFVKSLQRALRARGVYMGKLSGWLDPQTKLAVKLYQRKLSVNSEILALSTAEEFGLINHSDFKDIGHK